MDIDQHKDDKVKDPERRKKEFRSFLFLTVLLAPALAVALVGSLGLFIWVSQLIMGPPGPPA